MIFFSRHHQPGTRVRRLRAGVYIMFMIFFFTVFRLPASALADSGFTVDRMEVHVRISSDGLSVVEQTVEYSFLEDKSSMNLVLDAGQSRSISLMSVDLTDSRQNVPEQVRPAVRGDNSTAMTYEARQSASRLDLLVHMPVEAGSSRIVRVKYQLEDTVLVYQDIADFNLLLVSPGSEVSDFAATIVTEKGSIASHVFTAGSSETVATIDRVNGTVLIRDDLLRVDENLRIRCLLPISSVPYSGNKFAEKALDQILRDEAALSAVDSWIQDVMDHLPQILLAMMILAPFLLVTLLLPFRLPRLSGRSSGDTAPGPGDIPPPVASILVHRWTSGRELTAAMYDLAYHGCLRIEDDVFINQRCSDNQEEMTDYDRYLIQWMMARIGENGRVTTHMVTQAARGEAPIGFSQAYNVYQQLLRSYIRKTGLVERSGIIRGKILGIAYGCLYGSISVYMTIVEKSPVPMILLVPSMLFFIYSQRIRRLTMSGKDRLAALRKFRRYLKLTCLTEPSGPPPIKTWSGYLPYAIALGVEKAFLSNTGALYSTEEISGGGMFVEYGLTCRPDEPNEMMLKRFYEQLKGNSAAMLTAALYGKEKHKVRGSGAKDQTSA